MSLAQLKMPPNCSSPADVDHRKRARPALVLAGAGSDLRGGQVGGQLPGSQPLPDAAARSDRAIPVGSRADKGRYKTSRKSDEVQTRRLILALPDTGLATFDRLVRTGGQGRTEAQAFLEIRKLDEVRLPEFSRVMRAPPAGRRPGRTSARGSGKPCCTLAPHCPARQCRWMMQRLSGGSRSSRRTTDTHTANSSERSVD